MRLLSLPAMAFLLVALGGVPGAAPASETSAFLPSYYAPLLDGRNGLPPVHQVGSETGEFGRMQYASTSFEGSQGVRLTIERLTCERQACGEILSRIVMTTDRLPSSYAATFHDVTDSELYVSTTTMSGQQHLLAFTLPTRIYIWTYETSPGVVVDLRKGYQSLLRMVNRHRYELAMAVGNVTAGRWHAQIQAHALELVDRGRPTAALLVLRDLVRIAPFSFEAHAVIMELTDDLSEAEASAEAILRGAEDGELWRRAATFLYRSWRSIEDLPPIDSASSGLRVVLVALPPVDVPLVGEAAALYTDITGIPATLHRLGRAWSFGAPDRLLGQAQIESQLRRVAGYPIDFTEWTRTDYVAALRQLRNAGTPYDRYLLDALAEEVQGRSGQHDVGPHLENLEARLEPLRSDDHRLLYVGVTAANIYDGDANFLYSASDRRDHALASILSYAMLTTELSGGTFESRQRLVRRIAKEMVPASLKLTDIPRASDPTDPYSYSAGIRRVDEKSLELSPPTLAGIKALRAAPAAPE